MRFPVTIEFYGAKATIYQPARGFTYYRVSFKVAGKRRMLTFGTYSEAKEAAEAKVKELHKGQQSSALTGKQAQDAIDAFKRLDDHRKATGNTISLTSAVAEYLDAILKVTVPLSTAIDGYATTVVKIKRVEIKTAVAEFVTEREAKTKAVNGERPELSLNYFQITKLWLGWFEKTFPATVVCDLKKEHLDLFMAGRNHLAAKSKNHLRSIVRAFLGWCMRKDYLPQNHRLLEATSMGMQMTNDGDTDFYRPDELQALLNAADDAMRPIIALQGLAGVRLQEAQRLTWQDVFGSAGQIVISSAISKTRSRRTIEVCPALTAWLKPFRKNEGPLWTKSRDTWHKDFGELVEKAKVTARRNGLRHGFCSYHLKLHCNENLTALEAGNSPSMIHAHYKGLAITKSMAKSWFAVLPTATKPTKSDD